jgi:hypothetical protein
MNEILLSLLRRSQMVSWHPESVPTLVCICKDSSSHVILIHEAKRFLGNFDS